MSICLYVYMSIYVNLTVMTLLNINNLLNNRSQSMSKRYICKSKFHVCYHFLDMKILGEKTLLTHPVLSIVK